MSKFNFTFINVVLFTYLFNSQTCLLTKPCRKSGWTCDRIWFRFHSVMLHCFHNWPTVMLPKQVVKSLLLKYVWPLPNIALHEKVNALLLFTSSIEQSYSNNLICRLELAELITKYYYTSNTANYPLSSTVLLRQNGLFSLCLLFIS